MGDPGGQVGVQWVAWAVTPVGWSLELSGKRWEVSG